MYTPTRPRGKCRVPGGKPATLHKLLVRRMEIDGLEASCYDALPGECIKVSALFTRTQKDNHCQIRPVKNDDWLEIEWLLSHANRHYLALEWWTVQEWVGRPTFLLATDQHERPVGLMLAVVGEGPIAWLRAISVVADRYLTPLLEASTQAVLAQGGTGMAFLGNEDWIVSRLHQTGFREVNQVVTLRHQGQWRTSHGPPDLQLRTATATDIDAILAIDHAAFTPMWWYSREIFRRALNLAYSFDLAYLKGECVGYQLCTLRNGRGHIVRLATHPHWHRRGIAGRLLSKAMKALDEGGADLVTVNTQEDNEASLRLYSGFSFRRIGKPWAVWLRSLE